MANFYRRVCSALLVLSLLVGVLPTQRVQAAPGTATVSGAEESLQADKIAVALTVAAMPEKLTYTEFTEELDVTGGQIKIYWNDGTSEVMDMTREMVTGFDNTKIGTQTLTVTYGQVSATFQVEVVAKTAQSISVTQLPDKLTYLTTYEELDVTGGEITVTYADGTPAKVIPMTREMVTGFDNTQLGPQTLTVTYAGAETTYEVEIMADNLVSISCGQLPEQTVYLWNVDSIKAQGGTIVLHFETIEDMEIPMTPEMLSGFDNTQEGAQTITVTYQGKTTTFQVTVKKNNISQFASGLGTKEWPYLIVTKEHLNNVRLYPDSYFKMLEDIVFTEADFGEGGAYYNDGQGWQPIGTKELPFSGKFYGSGHIITGLKVNVVTEERLYYAGLFGYVVNGGIFDLGLNEAEISVVSEGSPYCGSIAGYLSGGVISNCYSTGNVGGSAYYAGGIVGYILNATISNCYNTGSVSPFNDFYTFAGGIVGYAYGSNIVNTNNSGGVSISGSFSNHISAGYSGGIAGYARESSSIDGCFNTGIVSVSCSADKVFSGGIVGFISSNISNCYNTGAVSAYVPSYYYSAYAGGITGRMEGSSILEKCYNTGEVSASSNDFAIAGGIAGYVKENSSINCCFNTGAITDAKNDSGGIAGFVKNGSIRDCYSIGTVCDSLFAGGIAGKADESNISSCYYLNTAQKAGLGWGKGETTACTWQEMTRQDTFQDFNFESIWTMEGSPEYGYPELVGVTTVSPCKESGHSTIRVGEKKPTCTEPGYTGDVHCTACGLQIEQGQILEAIGHSYGEPAFKWAADGKSCTVVFTCVNNKSHVESLEAEITHKVTTPATCESKGVTTYTAEVTFLGEEYTATKEVTDVEATGHSYGEPVFNWSEDGKSCTVVFTCENDESHVQSLEADITHEITTPATCESKGVTTYTAKVTFQGEDYTATKDVTDVEATGHSYGEPVFNWSEDGKSCTVVFTCENDEAHVQSLEAEITYKVTTPATCESKGVTTYTAKVTFQDEDYTATKEVTDVDALGHSYGEPVYNWSSDGKSCTVVFTCENDESHVESLEAEITHQVTTPATCESKGVTAYTAKVTFQGEDYTATKEVTDVDALGHSYGEPVFNWSEDGKSCTVVFTCENDESHVESLEAEITHQVTTPATCESEGMTTYTATVNFQDEDYTATKEVTDVDALGHSYGEPVFNWAEDGKSCTVVFTCENDESHVESLEAEITHQVTTPATCESEGMTTYTAKVTFQGEDYTATKEVTDVEATGHSYGEPVFNWSEDGKTCTVVFTCENDESHVESLTAEITHKVTTPATCESKGVTTYTAKVTFQDEDYTATKEVTDVEAIGHSYGEPVFNWSSDGKSCTVVFTCENDESHVESLTAEITHKVTTPATCESKGVTTYTATVTFQDEVYTATKNVTDVEAIGHSYGEPVFNWSEDGKSCTVVFTCENDESHVENLEAEITHKVTTPATCESKGVTTYTATVTFQGEDYTATKEVTDVEATGHSYGEPVFNWSEDGKSCTVVFTCENDESHVESLEAEISHQVTTPATCESKGVTTYTAKVNFRGEDYTATKEVADVAALGHNYGKPVFNWSSDGKSCTVVFTCENDESHVQKLRADITAEITTPATCGVAGETTYTASVTLENRKYSDTLTLADIPALAHDPRLENVREATDTQDGYTGDLVCAHCGEILEKGQAYELIFRVYHQASGKHHYTADAAERDFLAANGWIYEGIAWNAPKEGKPIYRVYHPATGNHLYTMDASERDFLAANGWNYEGILCYSADSDGVPLYRVCNPYTDRNPHHYTDSLEECAFLQSNGWRIEGISWYGLSK